MAFYPDYPDPMPAFHYLGDQGKGLMESALAEPQQTYGGRFLHRTIFDKAAALFRSIINNHSLLDGNKRLALATVAVFLVKNGYLFSAARDDAVAFALRVANRGSQPSFQEMSKWLRKRSLSVLAYSAKFPGDAEQLRYLERQVEKLTPSIRYSRF